MSPTRAGRLLEADVADELNLMIEPIVLGGNRGHLRDAARRFVPASVTPAGTGVQVCRPDRTAQSGHVPGA